MTRRMPRLLVMVWQAQSEPRGVIRNAGKRTHGVSRREQLVGATAALLVIAVLLTLFVRDRQGSGANTTPDSADHSVTTPEAPRESVDPNPSGRDSAVCRRFRTPRKLRILSFNTHRSTGSLTAVADEILELQPDIAILQEVDRRMTRTGDVDQADALADAVGMDGSFSSNLTRGKGQYGTLILTRFTILDEGRIPLRRAPGAEPRGLQWALIDVSGQFVRVYNTHLEAVRPRLRRQQARQVARAVRRDEFPLILGGDLNSPPESALIATLSRGLEDIWSAVGEGRSATSAGGRKIDYLFVRSMRPLRSQVATSAVSDHHRLWAEVRLDPPAQCEGRK